MSWLFALIPVSLIGSVVVGGAWFYMFNRSRQYDRDRKAYILTFPADLQHADVARWLRYTSRTVRRGQSVVFELLVTHEQITHRLLVPWQHAEDIIGQLRGLIPGVSAKDDEEHTRFDWTKAVEIGESNKDRPLDIPEPNDLAASILNSFHSLKEHEAVLMQWVITPAPRERPPTNRSRSNEFHVKGVTFKGDVTSDEINERRAKLKEPNVMAVLRVASHANTDPRAKSLIGRIKSSLNAVTTPFNYWTIRNGSSGAVHRIKRASSMTIWPAQLNITELSALIAWPIGGVQAAGLAAGRAKYHPASTTVPKEGRVFGDANMPGNERPVAVSILESNKHFHIVGRTGSGKSTLMANLAAQDIQAGRGVVLIDPKFDLFDSVTQYIPRERLNDVVIFDVGDVARPLGFNLLSQGSPQTVASEVQSIFSHIYPSEGAVRMPEVLYHALITLMTTQAQGGPFTFVDMIPMLWPESREDSVFSKTVIDGVKDPYIKAWWSAHQKLSKAERDKYLQPLRSRIWQLNSRAEIRNIIGQSESSIDMGDIVSGRKVLLVNLHGLSGESASLIGSSIVNNLWHAVKEGRSSQENPVSLYLDEFQHFVHSPISPETMLAEARSFGLSMHLAHQGLDQLSGKRALEDAVMNNAVNKIVFQRGLKDARTFASEFGSPVTDDDMKKLGQYEFVARVSTGTGISPPMTGVTRAPYRPENLGQAVRAASRAKYGKSASAVEAEIQARRRMGVVEKEAPVVGDEEWHEV